jgi:hypothetical protein
MVTTENTTAHIIEVYNHADVLTIENCPPYLTSVTIPNFNPRAGTYTSSQSVSISAATSGATIYYTLDGSAPTTSSPVYSSPIEVNATATIRAMATKDGLDNSSVTSATYTIVPAITGSEEPSTESLVTVFPNPAEDHVKIDLRRFDSEVLITLRDMNGRMLHHITTPGGMVYDLRTSAFGRGCYLISLKTKDRQVYKKLLLK